MTAVGGALIVWCSGYRGGKMEMRLSGAKSGQGLDDLFIVVEGGGQAVQGG
jgi:hypothetical protein